MPCDQRCIVFWALVDTSSPRVSMLIRPNYLTGHKELIIDQCNYSSMAMMMRHMASY